MLYEMTEWNKSAELQRFEFIDLWFFYLLYGIKRNLLT